MQYYNRTHLGNAVSTSTWGRLLSPSDPRLSCKKKQKHVHVLCKHTVFPQNLAAARFYFKAQFGVATIRRWLDFEGGVYWEEFRNMR